MLTSEQTSNLHPEADETPADFCRGLLAGQTGIIFGVAHKSSIAWAIAQSLSAAGMRLAFTYQGERLEENVRELAGTLEGALILPCDVTDDAQIEQVFGALREEFGRLDTLVHSVAFAKKEDLSGAFSETSRDGYLLAQNISAYSLTALTRHAVPMFEQSGGGSVITLTYLGGERVVKNYNVMGVAKAALEMSVRYLAADLGPKNIRVNAISAGPIKTLAARGISGFSTITDHMKEVAPLRRNVEAREVGDTALFLASPLSRGITGEVIHVDAGFHALAF
ncbi:MAG: enoyl-ACP reductase [Candidatus Melainabacteria bacterium]|nr:enoyl-ACP reductase [Candidatus Melainabacteria bacterium]